jgi:hypothetical protein
MFKGKAELIDPETKKVAATFNETEHHDGTTMATVRLEKPVVFQGKPALGGVRHRDGPADDVRWRQ